MHSTVNRIGDASTSAVARFCYLYKMLMLKSNENAVCLISQWVENQALHSYKSKRFRNVTQPLYDNCCTNNDFGARPLTAHEKVLCAATWNEKYPISALIYG